MRSLFLQFHLQTLAFFLQVQTVLEQPGYFFDNGVGNGGPRTLSCFSRIVGRSLRVEKMYTRKNFLAPRKLKKSAAGFAIECLYIPDHCSFFFTFAENNARVRTVLQIHATQKKTIM
jgi:hypothetical protein